MNNILEEAASRLSVDVDSLVAGGLARGRRLRRRRQVVVGLGSVAAVAVLGVGSVWAGHSFGSSTQAISPADSSPPSPSVSAAPVFPPHAALATTAEIEQRLRDALPGVAMEGLKVRIGPDRMLRQSGGAQEAPQTVGVGFTVGGAAVGFSVDWASAERVAMGLSVLPPDSECTNGHPMDPGCHALPDGSWIDTWNEHPEGGTGTPANEVENRVSYWRTDGWRIYSSALNSTEEKGKTVVAVHPPLTVAQLQALATSDIWFD